MAKKTIWQVNENNNFTNFWIDKIKVTTSNNMVFLSTQYVPVKLSQTLFVWGLNFFTKKKTFYFWLISNKYTN